MKFFLAILLVMSFVGIAVFGFLGMNHATATDHGGCLAAQSQGTDCPFANNTPDSLTFHLSAFKNFSSAIFEVNVFAALLMLALFLFGIGLGTSSQGIFPEWRRAHSRHRRRETFHPLSRRELAHWLAIHENSPAYF